MIKLDTVTCGDCLDVLPAIPDASIDAVITDPPYPHIKRDYGYWTEAEWWELMVEGVVPQVRRVLKPTGSAVFILQPNSEKVGKMRGWLWEFMAWVCREWNMVQDVWWWNFAVLPCGGAISGDLTRGSVKACVWVGSYNCFRNQSSVLWGEAERTKAERKSRKCWNTDMPSGHRLNEAKLSEVAIRRGGVTPFNLIPLANNRSGETASGHGAGTPLKLADWWTRYIVPPGGVVLDPFAGVATMALAAIQNNCHFIMIEKEKKYCETAERRIAEEQEKTRQMELDL